MAMTQEPSKQLVEDLRALGEKYGAATVAKEAARLTAATADSIVQNLYTYMTPRSDAYSPTDAQAALFAAVMSRSSNSTPESITQAADHYLSWLEADSARPIEGS